MSDEWSWSFQPPDLGDGLPVDALAEVERIAAELVFLGATAHDVGTAVGPEHGLRDFQLDHGRGFITFLVVDHLQLILIVTVILWE